MRRNYKSDLERFEAAQSEQERRITDYIAASPGVAEIYSAIEEQLRAREMQDEKACLKWLADIRSYIREHVRLEKF